ncbi:MAG: radical SAM protein [Bifidobacteriaceae bacterium]|nr:radical SAM protein [Bifidobacteriaceae bacterium]
MRTAVFFKGCPLRCPWCHNPESQAFKPEPMADGDGRVETIGRRYSVDELMEEASRDIIFYDQSGGGVTLTGGEPMAQDIDFMFELATGLVRRGIAVGVDTCGVAPTSAFERMADVAAFFLYDLKFIDSRLHRKWTGASNSLVLRNLQRLAQLHATIYLRLILLDGINADSATIRQTMEWLRENNIDAVQVNVLPYHRFGMDKFARLGRKATEFRAPSDETLERIRHDIEEFYPHVTVGG